MKAEGAQGTGPPASGTRRHAQSVRAKAAREARTVAAAETAAPAAPFSTGAGAGTAATGAAAGLGTTTGPGAAMGPATGAPTGAAVGAATGPGAPDGAVGGAATGDSSRSMYTCRRRSKQGHVIRALGSRPLCLLSSAADTPTHPGARWCQLRSNTAPPGPLTGLYQSSPVDMMVAPGLSQRESQGGMLQGGAAGRRPADVSSCARHALAAQCTRCALTNIAGTGQARCGACRTGGRGAGATTRRFAAARRWRQSSYAARGCRRGQQLQRLQATAAVHSCRPHLRTVPSGMVQMLTSGLRAVRSSSRATPNCRGAEGGEGRARMAWAW